jgi:dihydrofolate synthase/folylpolyglutamate synthase
LLARATEVGSPVVWVDEADAARTSVGARLTYSLRGRPSSPAGTTLLDAEGAKGRYHALEVTAPSYQARNVAVAIAAAEAALGRALSPNPTRRALAAMTFPGRFEVIGRDPWVILDGAHNPEAAGVLGTAIDEAFGSDKPIAVIGMVSDKDAEGFVRGLAPHVSGFVATQNSSYRSRSADEMAAIIARVTGGQPEAHASLAEAIAAARSAATGSATTAAAASGVLVTGSLYTAGEAKALLTGQRSEPAAK